jgi:hypothetical protein
MAHFQTMMGFLFRTPAQLRAITTHPDFWASFRRGPFLPEATATPVRQLSFLDPDLDQSAIVERLEQSLTRAADPDNRGHNILLAGPWGSGKTTIITKLKYKYPELFAEGKQREEKNFYLIEFSAWSASFHNDPRVAFLQLLALHVDRLKPRWRFQLPSKSKAVVDCFQKLLESNKELIRGGATTLAAANPAGGAFALLFTHLVFLLNKERIDQNHQDEAARPEAERQRKAMKVALTSIRQMSNCRQCLLIVEDLDRVRPEYAINFLETLYHLFLAQPTEKAKIQGSDWPLSSIWAVNIAMLEEFLYGHYKQQPSFDSTAYLTKIFDVRVNVPPLFQRNLDDTKNSWYLWNATLQQLASCDQQSQLPSALDESAQRQLSEQLLPLAQRLSLDLNYVVMGNLRLHEAVRSKCKSYWQHRFRSPQPPDPDVGSSSHFGQDQHPRLAREARLLALVEAFPGFRESIALNIAMWPEFINRLNSRRLAPNLDAIAHPHYRHIDDQSLITMLSDLEVIVYDSNSARYRRNETGELLLRKDLMSMLDLGF